MEKTQSDRAGAGEKETPVNERLAAQMEWELDPCPHTVLKWEKKNVDPTLPLIQDVPPVFSCADCNREWPYDKSPWDVQGINVEGYGATSPINITGYGWNDTTAGDFRYYRPTQTVFRADGNSAYRTIHYTGTT